MNEGKCQGCDNYGLVDDMNLCDDCGQEANDQDDEGEAEEGAQDIWRK